MENLNSQPTLPPAYDEMMENSNSQPTLPLHPAHDKMMENSNLQPTLPLHPAHDEMMENSNSQPTLPLHSAHDEINSNSQPTLPLHPAHDGNMADSPPLKLEDKDVLIAVMGLTGSGKSTIINLATQSAALTVGHDIESCTTKVDHAPPFELRGRRVVLLDTPGFDDTNKSEAEVLQIIAKELEILFRKKVDLHGILYIHRISEIRVGGVAKSNFRLFRKLCGDSSLKNVIIVTNMWSKVSEEDGARRVAQLSKLDDFFKLALDKQARLMHHKRDTVESIHEIIGAIMENHPVPLDIQEELVNQGKDITSTAAGQEIDKNLAEKIAELEEKMRKQAEEAEAARKEADEESRKELLDEIARAKEKVDAMLEEKTNMAQKYAEAQAEMIQRMTEAQTAWQENVRKQAEEAEAVRKDAAGAQAEMIQRLKEAQSGSDEKMQKMVQAMEDKQTVWQEDVKKQAEDAAKESRKQLLKERARADEQVRMMREEAAAARKVADEQLLEERAKADEQAKAQREANARTWLSFSARVPLTDRKFEVALGRSGPRAR